MSICIPEMIRQREREMCSELEAVDNVKRAVDKAKRKYGFVAAALFMAFIMLVYLIMLPVMLFGMAFGLVIGTATVFAMRVHDWVEDFFG